MAIVGLVAPVAMISPRVALGAAPVVVSSVNFNDSTTGTWSQSGNPTLSYVDDGSGGMALSILRAADYEGIQSATGLLEPGISYTFSMRARLPDGAAGTTDVRFVVKPNYNWVANTTIDATGWKTITGTYTLPDGVDPTTAQIYIGSTDQTGPYTIMIDDILITKPAPAPTTQTISSVNFNDGTPGAWSQSGNPTLSYVDDGNGGQALSILRAADYEGIQSPTGLLQAGVEYTFSMRARLPDGATGTTDVRFVVKPNYNWVANTTIDATGWKTITGTYTLPDGVDPTTAQIYIGSTDQTAPYAIVIDDILITAPAATPPPPPPPPTTTTIDSVNFNDSTTGDWIQSGSPTLTFVDDGSGGKALSIVRTNSWDGISSPTGLLAADTQYTFSMRARLPDGAAGSTSIRFVVNHDSSQYDWVANGTIDATGWTALTGTYTLPSGSDPSTAKAYIGSDDASDSSAYTILIDDILITGPAPSGGGGTGVLNSDCSGGYVGLTFDDGPYAGQTDKLVAALDAAHLRATFFDWGQHIAGNNSLMALQAANGWIGNHTWDHTDLTTLTQDQITAELTQTSDAINAAVGQTPLLMRPPYGSTNATVKAVEANLGLTEVLWDVDSQDWNGATTAQIVAKVKSAAAGQVVLMHDGLQTTRDAIPLIADALSAKKMCPGMISPTTAKAVAPPAQTVIDTNFENGFDGWVARNSQGTPTISLTTDEAHSPTHAALVSNRTGQGDGIGHDVTGIMKPGTTYVITAWVKFAAGSPTDALWLTMRRTNGGTDSYDTVAQFTGVPGDSWKQVTATYPMAAADSAFLYFETKYPDGTTAPFLLDDISVATQAGPTCHTELTPLKSTVTFPVGVAIDSRETTGGYACTVLQHFDQITAENHMKPEAWYDSNKNFRINPEATTLMDFAAANGIRVWGHTLVWHQQTPDWFFQHDDGTPLTNSDADKAILRTRLHDHIFNVAKALSDGWGKFGSSTNPLVGFDVVNEVISDGTAESDGLRRSTWYNVLGEEYIEDAFNYAEQAFNVQYAAAGATHPIKFAINDYNTDQAGKRQRLHDLVSLLLSHNVPVDIVGHQFHVSLSTDVRTLGDALTAFEDLPVKQDVSELDVMTGTPVDDAKLIDQGYFYRDAFRIFRAHSSSLFSVTVWGLYDGRSWRADNDPLLFNDGLQAKPAFYGAIDGKLDPRIRTANVFQADVPLDLSATTALEWKKLPLHTFGDGKASFQLRWESDHLSAYVAVNDSTSNATDAIVFKVGTTSYTFNRTGTGDVLGVVSEVSGGWVAVVHIPLSGAKLNDQPKFDVAVTDGASTVGWNDPGALGTLTLIEPLSFVNIAPANVAPTIDGTEDPVWALANTVTTDKQVSGTNTATAAVKTLWMGNTLYVFAHVTDPVLDATASDPWQQDSVEIYVDNINAKNGPYRADDTQMRISYKNVTSFGTGDQAAQQARLVSATSIVSDGYVVEAAISLLGAGGVNSFIGVDFQVNDGSGGKRIGIRNWADATNAGYQSTSHWGVGRLAPDMTVPVLHFVSPLYLTATANDGYHGLTAATAGVTATDAFDAASALTITGNAPKILPIGTTVVTWTVKDPAGNSSTAQQTVIVARRVPTLLFYMGWPWTQVTKSSSFTMDALLLTTSATCRSGMPIVFSFDRDPVTGAAGRSLLGVATTNRFGLATLTVASNQWTAGRYTLKVAFAGNNMGCLPSSESVTITVLQTYRRFAVGGAGLALASLERPAAIAPREVRI